MFLHTVYVHKIFMLVCLYFHKSAEDDSGPLDEAVGGSGDEASKNVNNVKTV